jgi:hypothetical protein
VRETKFKGVKKNETFFCNSGLEVRRRCQLVRLAELSLGKGNALRSESLLSKVKVMLPPTVSRPVCLVIKHASGSEDQIFITVTQLQACLLSVHYVMSI